MGTRTSFLRGVYFRFTKVRYAGRFEYALKELSG